jgi:hypothetical protein
MEKKYNLARMLEEIREDETVAPRKNRQVSQEEIKRLLVRKKQKDQGANP